MSNGGFTTSDGVSIAFFDTHIACTCGAIGYDINHHHAVIHFEDGCYVLTDIFGNGHVYLMKEEASRLSSEWHIKIRVPEEDEFDAPDTMELRERYED